MWWLDQVSADELAGQLPAWPDSSGSDAPNLEVASLVSTEWIVEDVAPVTLPDTGLAEETEQLQAQVRMLEEQLSQANATCAANAQQYSDEIATSRARLAELEQLLEQVCTQVRLLEEQLDQANATCAANAQQHSEEIAKLTARLAELEQCLEQRSATIVELEAKLHEQQAAHTAHEHEWMTAEAALQSLTRELTETAAALRERATQLETDLDSQRQATATLQVELTGRVSHDAELIAELRTQLQNQEQRQADFDAAARTRELDWQQREAAYLGAAAELQAQVAAAHELTQTLEQQLRSLGEECARRQVDLAAHEAATQRQIASLQAELEHAIQAAAKADAQSIELKVELQTLSQECEALRSQLQQEQAARSSVEAEAQRLAFDLTRSHDEIVLTHAEFAALQQQVDVERVDLSATLAGHTEAMRQSRQQVESLEAALVRQAREIERRDESLRALIRAGERTEQERAALQSRHEAQVAAHQAAQHAADAEILRVTSELNAIQVHCRALETQIAEARRELDSQEAARHNLEIELDATRDAQQLTEQRWQGLAQQANELRSSYVERESRYAELISDLRGESIQLTAQAIVANEETQRLQKLLGQHERDCAEAQREREHREILAGERQRTVEMLRGQVQALAKRVQREAAERRKVEAALARQVTQPDCPPHARELHERLETERRIAQLTQRLAAQRNLEQLLRRQAAAEIQRLNNLLAAGDKSAA